MQGRIVKGIGGFYYVRTQTELIECRARGVLRNLGVTPLVGDYVELELDRAGNPALSKVLPRKNELVRPAVANLDQIVIVAAVCSPDPDPVLLDKMLVAAEVRAIPAVICFNKTDLSAERDLISSYKKCGYPVLCVSAEKGTGMEELSQVLKDKTSAFAGNSGVGKSSLLNRILPEADLETGSVSKIERGRHTTRHAELMELPDGGYVMDTPGFGSFEVDQMEQNELKWYFPEFTSFEEHCRFRGCNHIGEPDCAVAEAVKQGLVSSFRLESYRKLYDQLKEYKKWK